MFGRKKQEDDAAKPAGEARDAKPAGKVNDAKPASKARDAKPAGKTRGEATGPLPLLSKSPEASPDLKPPPRTPVSLPKKPRPSVSLPEKPRRVPDMPSGRGNRPDQPGGNDGRKLVVAREIVLKCEISQCDRLVVEGHVEATMKDCKEIDHVQGPCRVRPGRHQRHLRGRTDGARALGGARDRACYRHSQVRRARDRAWWPGHR